MCVRRAVKASWVLKCTAAGGGGELVPWSSRRRNSACCPAHAEPGPLARPSYPAAHNIRIVIATVSL